jgi:hypothetical protein
MEILNVVRIKANTRVHYVGLNAEYCALNELVCEATTQINKTLKNISCLKPFYDVEANFCQIEGLKNLQMYCRKAGSSGAVVSSTLESARFEI